MSKKEGSSSSASVANNKIIVRYEECCKNHGARAGKDATDGCEEFMAMRIDPLACDACGCHRNFHRKKVVEVKYENCCKNHAIRIAKYAKYSYRDGCLEFMPNEKESEAGSKAALTCDACGCHRNFHKRKVKKVKVVHRPSLPPVFYGSGYDSDDYYDN